MFFQPKVSTYYNTRLKRVRIHFRVGECLKSRRPPHDVVEKARKKLMEEQEDGHIEYFEVFEKKFHALWHYIRVHGDELPRGREVRFTLAQGARAYSELIVQRSRLPGEIALLSCHVPERRARTIFFSAFVFHIIRQLQLLGVHEKLDGAQLRFLYLLMKAGQPIERWVLKSAPIPRPNARSDMIVEMDRDHRYVALHIFGSSGLQDGALGEKIYEGAVRNAKTGDSSLTWLKDHTLEKLRSLTNKVQSLGFGLPYSLLIAYDSQYRLDEGIQEEKAAEQEPVGKELPRWKVRVGALIKKQKSEFIDIEVDKDRMTAVVRQTHPKALESIRDHINSDWLMHEFHKQGIVFGYEKFLDAIATMLQEQKNPVGMRVAEGQPAQPGKKAYLHECYRDPAFAAEDQRGIRERQNSRLTRAGQLIAEVRYDDGIPGRNVFGEDVHAMGSAAEAQVAAGESVQLRGKSQFVALRDGLIEWDGHMISVVAAYVHEGSINLSSGNLAFDGTVVVRGDIEAGATVDVKGSLLVEGMISTAWVKVGGDLEVKGGIISSLQGLVSVGGNCRAQFVENSLLHVHRSLDVERSILNSQVICGERLAVKDETRGLISGGQISCWEAMAVRELGLSNGQTTICRIGTRYDSEIRWQRMMKRWLALREFREALLRHAPESPGSPNHQLRLQKAEKILQHAQRRLEQLEKAVAWNQNATLAVRGILDRNVEIHAAGKRVKVGQNLQEVLVSASPYRGSQINDLNVWEEFQKTWPEARLGDAS